MITSQYGILAQQNQLSRKKVVKDLGLVPTGAINVHGVHGAELRDTYLTFFYLPNNVIVGGLEVTDGDIAGADALIGMDIIGRGDFAVTNKDGKTTFSFRIPSQEKIDFVKQIESQNKAAFNNGRNNPCGCGSGLKYKKCHGKP